jgi:hypothetical protein
MHPPLSDEEGFVKRCSIFLGALPVLFLMFLLSWNVQAQTDVIEIGKFSAEPTENVLPKDWKPLTFKNIDRHNS